MDLRLLYIDILTSIWQQIQKIIDPMKTLTSHIHRVSLTIFQYYVLPILLSSKLTLFQSYTPPILHSSNLTHYITHYTLTISQIGFTHTLHITHYTLSITM